jgi:hypothetical protein
MEKLPPRKIITEIINKAFLVADLPKSNQSDLQQMFCDLYIADAMVSAGTARKKAITDKLKVMYKTKIDGVTKNEVTLLAPVFPFTLSVKVSNARETFDLSEYVKVLAKEYNLSVASLLSHSKNTVKKSAAPTSFTVAVVGDGEQNGG